MHAASRNGSIIVGILVLGVVVVTLGGYAWSGDCRAVERAGRPDAGQLVTRLQAAVADKPNNVRARLLLAQAEQRGGHYAAAVTNLHHVNVMLKTPNPDLLAAEAQARLASGESLEGPAGLFYEQVLALRPDDQTALWYLGLQAAAGEDRQRALDYWDRLLPLTDDARENVRSRHDALAGHKPKLNAPG